MVESVEKVTDVKIAWLQKRTRWNADPFCRQKLGLVQDSGNMRNEEGKQKV